MAKISIVPWIVKKLKRCIGIVEDTDTASQAIASNKYVIWKGDVCKSISAISEGDTLSSSNLSAVNGGVGNDLSQAISNLETAFEPFEQVSPYVGGMVNLSGYNTENNPYTCPTNGYIRLSSSGEAVYIIGKTSEYATFLEGNGKAVSAYAVKGMKFFVNGSSARFLPLTE